MEPTMKSILMFIAVIVFAAAALATPGCPPGTKRHCVQGKGGVTCSCR
jgi:hypothetical protein